MNHKRARKVCPGCTKSFSSRHFYDHKKDNLKSGSWCCEKRQQIGTPVSSPEASFDEVPHGEADTSDEELNCYEEEYLKCQIGERQGNYKDGDTRADAYVCGNLPDYLLEFHDSPPVSENEASSSCFVDDDFDDNYHDEQWEEVADEEIERDVTVLTLSPESPQDKRSSPLNLVKWICAFICFWQGACCLPDAAVEWLLRFLKVIFQLIGAHSTYVHALAAALPSSLYLLWKLMEFDQDNFVKYVTCPACNTLYTIKESVITTAGQTKSLKCTFVRFPNHPQKWRRKPCGEMLMKKVTLQSGKEVFYPRKIFCYKNVIQSLKCLLDQGDLQELSEHWRKRSIPEGFLTDITDGRIWKEFGAFFKDPWHYGLMLNFDFFQPFKHGKYSVGVFYLTLINLPRSLRFKPENVILVGVLPPINPGTSLNPFLRPIVQDLQQLWDVGFVMKQQSTGKVSTVKAALLCVACDIPAARKVAGFLSHNANRGCSKCLKVFPGGFGNKDYSGFNRSQWVDRTDDDHQQKCDELKACKTQEQLNSLQTEYGIRLSVLCDLSYFSAVRFTIIDPMHNLYLGTAKRMVELWLELDIISEKQLKDIQARVDNVHTASDIGRIPRKIASSFGGFTADQWKNWTNIFSIFALNGILPKKHLECWRHFVLASRLLSSKVLRINDVENADQMLHTFCTLFEKLYGGQNVTPNMHLHGHLTGCVLDYGPVYSFWLFSYERYNGILGNIPTNQKSVEVQLMRKFLRDNAAINMQLPKEENEELRELFHCRRNTSGSLTAMLTDPQAIISALDYATVPVDEVDDWQCDLAIYKLQLPKKRYMLSEDEHCELLEVYNILYPNLAIKLHRKDAPRTCWTYKGCEFGNEYLGSIATSPSERSSLVLAAWLGHGNEIDVNAQERPCQIQFFILHYPMIENVIRPHVFVKVKWFQKVPDNFRYSHGCPVEWWSASFEIGGSSSYLPVQRIRCKFVASYELNRRIGTTVCVIPRTGLVSV